MRRFDVSFISLATGEVVFEFTIELPINMLQEKAESLAEGMIGAMKKFCEVFNITTGEVIAEWTVSPPFQEMRRD